MFIASFAPAARPRTARLGPGIVAAALAVSAAGQAQTIAPISPGNPMKADPAADPVLQTGRQFGPTAPFRDAVAAAVDRHPGVDEVLAQQEEAQALRREARSNLFPSVDLGIASYRTLARNFGGDTDNLLEQLRPDARTDATASVNQTLWDFGANQSRVEAASARLRAAAAAIDNAADAIALNTIAAWYDVFVTRRLLSLATAYRDVEIDLRSAMQRRIALGASAQVDIARVDNAIANIDTRLAVYRRRAETAEARFQELTGTPAPADLQRGPMLGDPPDSAADARDAAAYIPAVRTAQAQAEAARRDATAARRDTLPRISAGIDAGRYGILQDSQDYDVRARVTLQQRLFGAGDARADQFRARATAAEARASRIREEGMRDAAIAWADLQAYERQLAALEASYISTMQTRTATARRFEIVRGDILDVLNANDSYFAAATAYLDAIAQRDAAHYVLLSRTGKLLDALSIARRDRGAITK